MPSLRRLDDEASRRHGDRSGGLHGLAVPETERAGKNGDTSVSATPTSTPAVTIWPRLGCEGPCSSSLMHCGANRTLSVSYLRLGSDGRRCNRSKHSAVIRI